MAYFFEESPNVARQLTLHRLIDQQGAYFIYEFNIF